MVRMFWAALAVALSVSCASAVPRIDAEKEILIVASLTDREIWQQVKGKMPYPVVEIFHWKQGEKIHFAIDLDIDKLGLSDPRFNVRFELPKDADADLFIRAVKAASKYAENGISEALRKAQAATVARTP